MARIVLNTFGSLGDLHPYLAIAIGLRRRGHDAVLATSEVYRRKVIAEGIEFASVRPDLGVHMNDAVFLQKLWDRRTGSQFLLRDYLVPRIEQSYDDLLEACRGADLLLTHAAGYAGPIVAEKMQLPWLSIALQPMLFFSAYDPPILPGGEWARHLHRFSPDMFRTMMKVGRLRLDRWGAPIAAFRKRIGLKSPEQNPLLYGFSPSGTIALISEVFAQPQPDWPPNVTLAGFAYYDQLGDLPGAPKQDLSELGDFLRSGPSPVLFTLGSSAMMHPGEFFRESIVAAHSLGIRAILLAGPGVAEIHNPLPDSIFVAAYAPYSQLMPRCAAVVHQGGIGTTAQTLRAGKPMIVVPWSHDQPDNAERVRRLGFGRSIRRDRYYAPRVANELRELLTNERYNARARQTAAVIATEDSLGVACDVIEEALTSALLPN